MSKISNIEVQKKNKNRANLFVDGEYLISLDIGLVHKMKLKVNDEIDRQKLVDIIKSDNFEKAKTKALDLLSKSNKSEKKIIEKLSDSFDDKTIDIVIEFLKSYSFIDDEKYAKMLVKDSQNVKRVGRNRIKQNLYSKGISSKEIVSAVSSIDEELELENAIYLAEKKYKKLKGEEHIKIKNKMFQHLAYKGFDYDVIKSAIDRVLEKHLKG
ncbi:recombination regulator RecX [Peptostreptococcus sp. D1]|uniref:recombination regulator RecX n=1 Tax=Peptostreptococcus sp. D1 TaxID=72304 RepID=UPI0008DF7A3A|nr:recombination regulator RecX [Peptostreptococcus sp. D1]SFE50434.1 regulatory protein [Peptostreptococcus sp. D1]